LIVFDTSSLVGALTKDKGPPRRALLHALAFDVVASSSPVAAEWRRVLHRPKLERRMDLAFRDRLLDRIVALAEAFEPAIRVDDCRDPTDNMFLELALAAGAEVIVSSDNDLLVLDPWRGVRILTARRYLESVGAV
jgi:hypothetical protein